MRGSSADPAYEPVRFAVVRKADTRIVYTDNICCLALGVRALGMRRSTMSCMLSEKSRVAGAEERVVLTGAPAAAALMHMMVSARVGVGFDGARLRDDGFAAQRGDRAAQRRLFTILRPRSSRRVFVRGSRPVQQVRPVRRRGVRRARRFRRARSPGRARRSPPDLGDSRRASGCPVSSPAEPASRDPVRSDALVGPTLVPLSHRRVRDVPAGWLFPQLRSSRAISLSWLTRKELEDALVKGHRDGHR